MCYMNYRQWLWSTGKRHSGYAYKLFAGRKSSIRDIMGEHSADHMTYSGIMDKHSSSDMREVHMTPRR
jgi:hypothetical protein